MGEKITLKENKDFQKLYRRGKSFVSPALVTYVKKNKSDNLRYGITTGKKIGNAVRRSRSRRVIRAAFREILPNVKGGCDIVFVARGKTPYVKSYVIKDIMLSHFKKAGLLKEKEK